MGSRKVTRPRPGSAGRGKKAKVVVTAAQLRRWAEDNPLWRWRQRGRVSRPMCAAMFGVTSTTIWQWEHGAVMPSAANMDKLVALLGPDTVHHWVSWVARKPGWEREG